MASSRENRAFALVDWEAKIIQEFKVPEKALSECKEYLMSQQRVCDADLYQLIYHRLGVLKKRNNIFLKDMNAPTTLLLCCANQYQPNEMSNTIMAFGWFTTAIQVEAVDVVKELVRAEVVDLDGKCRNLIEKSKNEELMAFAKAHKGSSSPGKGIKKRPSLWESCPPAMQDETIGLMSDSKKAAGM